MLRLRGSLAVVLACAVPFFHILDPPPIAPAWLAVLNDGEGTIEALAISPAGELIVATRGHGRCLWRLGRHDRRQRTGPATTALVVAVSPDGATLAVGAHSRVILWDVTTDALRIEIVLERDDTRALAFSPDGATIAVAGERSITVRDTATGRERVGAASLPGVTSLAFSPDGQALATGDEQGNVLIWDLTTGLLRAAVRAHNRSVTWLDFSRDGRRLVSASKSDSVARVWDAATCHMVVSLLGHPTPVQAAVISPDGRMVATAAMHRDLRLWDARNGEHVATLKGHDGDVLTMAFSPDGRMLVAGGMGWAVWAWDLEQAATSRKLPR